MCAAGRLLLRLAGALCLVAATACGAGGGGPGADTGATGAAQHPGVASSSSSEPYRWLVPTQGATPSIAAENQAAGTSAWRLPGPADLIGGQAHGGRLPDAGRRAGDQRDLALKTPLHDAPS